MFTYNIVCKWKLEQEKTCSRLQLLPSHWQLYICTRYTAEETDSFYQNEICVVDNQIIWPNYFGWLPAADAIRMMMSFRTKLIISHTKNSVKAVGVLSSLILRMNCKTSSFSVGGAYPDQGRRQNGTYYAKLFAVCGGASA